ncbi:MAG: glycerophosphoryl diester phosphodiesterase membrane domain-containing protein [Anaeromyxobacter sp.]
MSEPLLAHPPPLQTAPFTVGGAISTTFAVWARNLVPFTLLTLALEAPVYLLTWLAQDGGSGAQRAVQFLGQLVSLVVTAALTYGVLRSLAGERVELGRLFSVGLSRFGAVLGTSILVGLAVIVGLILLIVPGIIVGVGLSVALPALLAEKDLGATAALSRSWELTKGRRWEVFAVLLVIGLVMLVGVLVLGGVIGLAVGVTAGLGGDGTGFVALVGIAVGVISAPLTALYACAPAVLYRDLRVQKEGVDTASLAAVFE